MREYLIKDYLVKPFRRSELINAISKQLNGQVERSWQDLPTDQRNALEGTSVSVGRRRAGDLRHLESCIRQFNSQWVLAFRRL
jgi:DNA-binding response OmpR family regulator